VRRHSGHDECVDDVATQSALHRCHSREETRGACRGEESDRSGGSNSWSRTSTHYVGLSAPGLISEAIAVGADTFDADALNRQVQLYHSAAQVGITHTAARSDTVMRKHNALARRLIDRQDDYLRFTQDRRIPPDNNGSERDIRMIKLRQKVSGCLRTLTGAQQFCAIRSYLSTAAKHGKQFFDTLIMLAEGRPWLPATN
jgi:hypothetical protein